MLTRGASTGSLTLEVDAGGRVTSTDGRIDCDAGGGACSATYSFAGHGAEVPSVTLTALAEAGKRAQWLDDCEASAGDTCVINMVADRTASVRFIADTVTRSLSVDVVGSGRVTSCDSRIDYRATGVADRPATPT